MDSTWFEALTVLALAVVVLISVVMHQRRKKIAEEVATLKSLRDSELSTIFAKFGEDLSRAIAGQEQQIASLRDVMERQMEAQRKSARISLIVSLCGVVAAIISLFR